MEKKIQHTNKSNNQPRPHLTDILRHKPNRSTHLPRNTNCQFSVHVRLLVASSGRHELIVYIAALHAVQNIQQEDTATDSLVLERTDTASAAALFALFVGPFDHLIVRDFAFAETLRKGRQRLRDVAAHELPYEAEGKCSLAIGDIGALNANKGKAHLFAKLNSVISVFNGFEAHQFCSGSWALVDMPPVDASRNYLVVSLQEDGAVCEIIEKRDDRGLDVERVKPKGEDAGFALSFRVEVIDLCFFLFGNGIKAWVSIEEVGYEGEIQFGVAGDQRCR